MKLIFFGGAGTVTGSKYLLESNGRRILIDCGLFQGPKELRLRNWEPFPVPPASIDAVVLTHAHIDHSGYLPRLIKQGFKGPIYASEATSALAEILLKDSGHLQEEDAMRANRYGYSKHKPALPLYTEVDAELAIEKFKEVPFHKEIALGAGIHFVLKRAGHILGSSTVTIHCEGQTLLFSGDVGRPNDPIMEPPEPPSEADYLLVESTYGGREHPDEKTSEKLARIVKETAARGGTVLIPSFAVGRAQAVLYLLHQLLEKSAIPRLEVYLDSPMAEDATDIFSKFHEEHRLSSEEAKAVCRTAHYVKTVEESKAIHQNPHPKIIISASGMCEGGRVLHHLKNYAPRAENCILFVGFQAPMTRGEKILSGASEVKIHGESVPIRARVEELEGLSSHADREELLDWLGKIKMAPRKVYLIHGEEENSLALKEAIEERFHWNVVIPKVGDTAP